MHDYNLKEPQRVSSTEMQKNWGHTLRTSLRRAVLITQHNEETHALIPIEEFKEYQKLKEGDRIAMHVTELSDEDFQAFMDAEIPPEHDPEKR